MLEIEIKAEISDVLKHRHLQYYHVQFRKLLWTITNIEKLNFMKNQNNIKVKFWISEKGYQSLKYCFLFSEINYTWRFDSRLIMRQFLILNMKIKVVKIIQFYYLTSVFNRILFLFEFIICNVYIMILWVLWNFSEVGLGDIRK